MPTTYSSLNLASSSFEKSKLARDSWCSARSAVIFTLACAFGLRMPIIEPANRCMWPSCRSYRFQFLRSARINHGFSFENAKVIKSAPSRFPARCPLFALTTVLSSRNAANTASASVSGFKQTSRDCDYAVVKQHPLRERRGGNVSCEFWCGL